MTREIRVETNHRGAGLYGASAPSHVTACVHSNNPYGHNPACRCGWASQRVPYLAELLPSPHEGWWPDDSA